VLGSGAHPVHSTALIEGYGFSANETFLISTPAGVVQLITNLGIPYLAGRWHNRMLGACFGMAVGLFGISLMAGLAMHNPLNGKIGQLVGYYIVIGNSATALILILSVVSTNTGMNHVTIRYHISNDSL
jgi:ACS family allantoate permease-like MFS transporter